MDINGHLKDVSLRKADAAEGRAATEESSENNTHSSAHVQKTPQKNLQICLCERRTVPQIYTERRLKIMTSVNVLRVTLINNPAIITLLAQYSQ